MVEKIGRVSNPLTIIAIFAGIAEISGVVVLPLLTDRNQNIFIYYVMIFPTILVCLFFFVLWKRHSVLYSPGDYRDDDSFVKMASNKISMDKLESSESNFKIIMSNGEKQ